MLLLLIVKYVGLYEVTEDNTKLDGLQRRTAYRYVSAGNVGQHFLENVFCDFDL